MSSTALYELCPSCHGRTTVVEKVGLPPIQLETNVPCPTCAAKGFVPNGLTAEIVEDLKVRAAAHERALESLIRYVPGKPSIWVVGEPILDATSFGTFMAARDAIDEWIGLRGGEPPAAGRPKKGGAT